MNNNFLDKYPKAKKFLDEHPGMTLDDALVWTDIEIKKLERNKNERS